MSSVSSSPTVKTFLIMVFFGNFASIFEALIRFSLITKHNKLVALHRTNIVSGHCWRSQNQYRHSPQYRASVVTEATSWHFTSLVGLDQTPLLLTDSMTNLQKPNIPSCASTHLFKNPAQTYSRIQALITHQGNPNVWIMDERSALNKRWILNNWSKPEQLF